MNLRVYWHKLVKILLEKEPTVAVSAWPETRLESVSDGWPKVQQRLEISKEAYVSQLVHQTLLPPPPPLPQTKRPRNKRQSSSKRSRFEAAPTSNAIVCRLRNMTRRNDRFFLQQDVRTYVRTLVRLCVNPSKHLLLFSFLWYRTKSDTRLCQTNVEPNH